MQGVVWPRVVSMLGFRGRLQVKECSCQRKRQHNAAEVASMTPSYFLRHWGCFSTILRYWAPPCGGSHGTQQKRVGYCHAAVPVDYPMKNASLKSQVLLK
eukprot:5472004-Amphidinium_carterae.1